MTHDHGDTSTPASAGSIREYLIERYRRFRDESFPKYREHFAELATGQQPRELFIACSDSRVVPHVLLSSLPGDIFECRIVGNIVPSYGSAFGGVSATLEYAASVLKVQAVIVCGHSDCGAMKALAASERYEDLKPVSSWLHHADAAKRIVAEHPESDDERARLAQLTRENVLVQMRNIETHPAIAVARRRGLEVFGWVYDIETGEIESYDEEKKAFVPLEESMRTKAKALA